eukprot:gene2313-18662_t
MDHWNWVSSYLILYPKEGITVTAEAEEGEEAPAPTWGEKADEFLEANKDKLGAAAAEEAPKEPLKKVTKVLTLEAWACAGEGAEAKWADLNAQVWARIAD